MLGERSIFDFSSCYDGFINYASSHLHDFQLYHPDLDAVQELQEDRDLLNQLDDESIFHDDVDA
jgi:hypothetical protein